MDTDFKRKNGGERQKFELTFHGDIPIVDSASQYIFYPCSSVPLKRDFTHFGEEIQATTIAISAGTRFAKFSAL